MDYKKEYGRYKAKAERQENELDALREKLKGIEATQEGLTAAILAAIGATGDKPLRVEKALLEEAVKGKYRVVTRNTPGGWELHCVGAET